MHWSLFERPYLVDSLHAYIVKDHVCDLRKAKKIWWNQPVPVGLNFAKGLSKIGRSILI